MDVGAGGESGGGGGGILQPASRLLDELVAKLGSAQGRAAHAKLERGARDAILQALYALRHSHKLQPRKGLCAECERRVESSGRLEVVGSV